MAITHLEVVEQGFAFEGKVIHTVEVHSAPGEYLSRVKALLQEEYPGRLIREVETIPAIISTSSWWDSGNDLALVAAMCKFAREQDGGFQGETHSRLNSGLIGVARQIGMNEDDIRDAFDSDRNLTIYEP